MNKWILMMAVAALAVGSNAGLVNWYADNLESDPVGATLQSGWLVAMYRDVGTNNNSSATWYNDLRLDENGLATSSGVTAEDALLAYTTAIFVDTGLVTFSPKLSQDIQPDNAEIYSVIFNATSITGATEFVVVDSTTFNVGAVSAPSAPLDYNTTSIAGGWQAIPEPAVASLIGLFGVGTLFGRRIFRKD